MGFPHEKRERSEYGSSPGNGISPAPLSAEPLASEDEAAAEMRHRRGGLDESTEAAEPSLDFLRLAEEPPDPTEGDDDPYVFDNIGDGLGAALPKLSDGIFGGGPRF